MFVTVAKLGRGVLDAVFRFLPLVLNVLNPEVRQPVSPLHFALGLSPTYLNETTTATVKAYATASSRWSELPDLPLYESRVTGKRRLRSRCPGRIHRGDRIFLGLAQILNE